ncbi:MAG: hypothetical protein IPG50_34145 [Myxococcales bacterium]|nr:hypothetical protein [Myxococcales bacterium]
MTHRAPTTAMRFGRLASLATAAALLSTSPDAFGLDKQGSAHGGQVGGDAEEFNVSGAFSLGAALYNPSYAARPDNTGLALFRYALHTDVDLLGRKLSIPIDVNMFTDRERRGGRVLLPTEFDVIGGVTTTQSLVRGADLELGARVEHDRPIDQGSFSQTYADVRGRLLYSLATVWPSLGRELADGDISGYVTLGWFGVNPTYAARPDNTGLALFRYVAHTELSVWHDYLSIGVDGTFFSDRRGGNVVAPSELDLTYEVIGRYNPFEVHLAYERDMPIDRGGLVQSFIYALFVYGFDFKHAPKPLETRGTIPSP